MPPVGPETVPFPLSSFPGATQQESAGRLINCYAEPLGDPQQNSAGAPKDGVVWRRSPGLTQFAMTTQSGYRGGLIANNLAYEVFANDALTIDGGGAIINLGPLPGTKQISIARNQATIPDVVVVDIDNGAYVLNSAPVVAATLDVTLDPNYGNYNAGDVITFGFSNAFDDTDLLPQLVSYTVTGAEGSAAAVASAIVALINAAFTTITADNVGGTSNVVTISQSGSIGNSTFVTATADNPGIAIAPSAANLSGGTGVTGVFTGVPTFYNGQGNLPQPNSVSFQDGYVFFTIGDNRVFATALNSLVMSALTFVYILAKSDVVLLRGIPYQGYMFFFTTGSCEVWSDGANPAPNFPYNRQAVLTTGLIQSGAIAGFETGFDDLLWVAQDYGVWRLPQNTLAPVKVSPPDLDRLIEAQIKAGALLEAGVHMFAGKKFWVLSSPSWTWQFNLGTNKWSERWSLLPSGAWGRWRGVCGHPAFNKWLIGDTQSGAMHYLDDENFSDVTTQDLTLFVTTHAPQMMRIESGLVERFPARARVARADFHFVRGTGRVTGNLVRTVLGAIAGTGGVVRLIVDRTLGISVGDTVIVTGIVGTTEANGTWVVSRVVDATHIELQGSLFANAYVSGGTVTDLYVPALIANPTVAISWADDGGLRYRPPVLRNLGQQSIIETGRISVKNTGLSGVQGRRWRMDVSDPVYVAFLKATQSDDPSNPSG